MDDEAQPQSLHDASCSDLYSAWDDLRAVFDFQNRPIILDLLKWYISKTGNPLSIHFLSSFLIYLPEIEMAKGQAAMSLSELQNHHYQLALALRNHAKSDLMAEVRKRLDKNLFEPLLSISPSSLDMDLYMSSLKTSVDTFQHYATDHKVHIPFHPTLDDFGMDILLGEVIPQVSAQAQVPSESMSPFLVEGACLEFRGVSFHQNVKAQGIRGRSP